MNLALAGVERIKSRGEAASTANNDESNAMRLVLYVVNVQSASGKSSFTLTPG